MTRWKGNQKLKITKIWATLQTTQHTTPTNRDLRQKAVCFLMWGVSDVAHWKFGNTC